MSTVRHPGIPATVGLIFINTNMTKSRPIRICESCKNEYVPKRVDKQLRFCSTTCQRTRSRSIPDRPCEKCGTVFRPIERSGRFCSRTCAWNGMIRRGPSQETISKIRATMQGKVANGVYVPPIAKGRILGSRNRSHKPDLLCIVCQINPSRRWRKTCSQGCANSIPRGGYREKSGRGKSGYYKGIFCNSQWELAYLIWMFDHERSVIRNTKGYPYVDPDSGKVRTYYPDFITDEGLIEVKGWGRRSGINAAKIAAVDGPIKFLYEADLEHVFEYIARTYGKSRYNVFELYENRPDHRFAHCRICNGQFEVRRKSKGLYCSPKCSIRGNHFSKKLDQHTGIEPAYED